MTLPIVNPDPFPFQLALLLLLSIARTEAEEFPAANATTSAGDNLMDVEIKTMLRDYIDTDKLGVGLVIGIVDEHGYTKPPKRRFAPSGASVSDYYSNGLGSRADAGAI